MGCVSDELVDYIELFRKCGQKNQGNPDSSESELLDSSTAIDIVELNELYYNITGMSTSAKELRLKKPLNTMYGVYEDELTKDELQRIEDRTARYDINFDDITVDELRIRIQTFNNLVVRLPVDTKHNKMASLHIFEDWSAFVQGAVNHLIDAGELFIKGDTPWKHEYDNDDTKWDSGIKQGLGTDGLLHWFKELYIDDTTSIPLMDYSYICKDEDFEHPYIDDKTGKPVADRWDYWSESDFN